MKERLRQLISTYRQMAARSGSKRSRHVLENVIEDLENILREAQ